VCVGQVRSSSQWGVAFFHGMQRPPGSDPSCVRGRQCVHDHLGKGRLWNVQRVCGKVGAREVGRASEEDGVARKFGAGCGFVLLSPCAASQSAQSA